MWPNQLSLSELHPCEFSCIYSDAMSLPKRRKLPWARHGESAGARPRGCLSMESRNLTKESSHLPWKPDFPCDLSCRIPRVRDPFPDIRPQQLKVYFPPPRDPKNPSAEFGMVLAQNKNYQPVWGFLKCLEKVSWMTWMICHRWVCPASCALQPAGLGVTRSLCCGDGSVVIGEGTGVSQVWLGKVDMASTIIRLYWAKLGWDFDTLIFCYKLGTQTSQV